MPSNRPAQRFGDIVTNIDFIKACVDGMTDASDLVNDQRSLYAVDRALLIIAEAATKLGQAAETYAPNQPWSKIRSLGNQIRHGYDTMDYELLWNTVILELDLLRADCVAAIEKLELADGAGETT